MTQPPEIERLLYLIAGRNTHTDVCLYRNEGRCICSGDDLSAALAAVRAKLWVEAQHECPTDVGVTANCAPCEMAADAVTVCDVLRAENARMVDACRELKEERIAHHATLQREADAIAERDALRAENERLRRNQDEARALMERAQVLIELIEKRSPS